MKLFYKKLVCSKKVKSGRNNTGKIVVRRKQGGVSNLYRKINYNLTFNFNDNYKLLRIEYDPNRSSFIGLVYNFGNNVYDYILLPNNLSVGDYLLNPREFFFKKKPGFRTNLYKITLGSLIHNISLGNSNKGILCRSRGTFAKILQKNIKGRYVKLRLPSGEERLVNSYCKATLGIVSSLEKSYGTINAGWSRRMGNRPSVRGVAMNPVDHPHGGGEGKTSGGRPSVSPWGKITIGKPTSKKNKMVIVSRKQI